ncbi:MAG: translation initiation factor IF-3 [Prochloraceae cyanobacterium]|nr:translation initiation factor IF-3 [Prochloraceae cyanobacterium]
MRKPTRNKSFKQFQQKEKYKINNKITAAEVRLIRDSGEQLGIKTLEEALAIATEDGLDLVEIAPQAEPPVCKIIDYGKFKYRQQKKQAEAKKKQVDNAFKELKVGYCTDTGDLNTKLKQARKFLSNGSKVKFSMRLRGRERAFFKLGKEKLESIVDQLSDVANLDELSAQSSSVMHVILTPN